MTTGEGSGAIPGREIAGQAPSVLVIEDDPAIRSALLEALREEGYLVQAETNGGSLATVIEEFSPDLAILDVRLPTGPDGYALSRQLRASRDVPVLFLTAADQLSDRLAGFDAGADDYMVKPFSIAELLARARALLRRSGRVPGVSRQAGDLVLDDDNRTAHRHGARLDLTRTEFGILSEMTRQPGKVFSKLQLMSRVWGFDSYVENVVEVHVSSLRKKLEAHGPRVIHTVRGSGYVYRP